MLSETPVTITICLGPFAVETRPTTSAGNRLCSSRGWLSSLIFHSSFMSLTLAAVIMRSSRCQAVRCESPPSVSQSAGLSSVNPYALQAAMQPQTIAIIIVSFRIIEFLRKSVRSPALRRDYEPRFSFFQVVGLIKVRVIGDVEEIRPKLQIEHGLS